MNKNLSHIIKIEFHQYDQVVFFVKCLRNKYLLHFYAANKRSTN